MLSVDKLVYSDLLCPLYMLFQLWYFLCSITTAITSEMIEFALGTELVGLIT